MEIKADKEAKQVIHQLCDIGLKASGLSSLSAINALLGSIEDIQPVSASPEEAPAKVPAKEE